ncbi:lipase member N-like [Thamnophis elegans]|uniref:lipase member N-like n=1 Tax=Thamnophis elegans TaxID=35005 RepID=UPI0013783362|nr:lipase member N-like [Thamnophis elegans]
MCILKVTWICKTMEYVCVKKMLAMMYDGKVFQAYDYGTKEKNYNQAEVERSKKSVIKGIMTSPVYKLEDIKIPIALWSGGNDLLVNIKDVHELIARLSNVMPFRNNMFLNGMKMRSFIIMACLCHGLLSLEELGTSERLDTNSNANPECFMNISEIIHFHNYPSEEYRVETEDGYILTINRIPYGRYNGENKAPRPAVFLAHSCLGDGSHWISNQPHNSFGFILADNGYDVWLGNSRGNTWSSNHKTLKPWQEEFWSFSFHEMGYYDIPAVINFILNKTKQPQLYYVGHSEGTTAGFISFSSWPKLAEKIKVFFGMGPAAAVKYTTCPVLNIFFNRLVIKTLFGYKGIMQDPSALRKLKVAICNRKPEFCESCMSVIVGSNTPNYNMSRMDMYVAHSPAGTSEQNLLHWKQNYNKKVFEAYDYGTKEKNMEKYNQMTPPVYKLEDIKIPVALWSGGNDLLVNIKDVQELIARLSNVIHHQHVPEWQHLDFIWGLDATEVMYMPIIEIMKKYP